MSFPLDATRFDDRDRVYAMLRGLALIVGLSYGWVSVQGVGVLSGVIWAHAGFLVYSALAYGVAWPLFGCKNKNRFYFMLAALDLGFAILLVLLTGGAHSPFYRAFYVWIAMFAFYFGRRGGLPASIVVLGVYLGLHADDGFRMDPWLLIIQSAGMLMHGPLIGFFTDRERRRASELRAARDRLAEANRRLVEEQSKLIQAEKLSSIGLLAAGVAHEINNPLAGLMGCLKVLRDPAVSSERRAEYYETAREGLERIRGTVRGLLDYARQRPTRIEGLDAAGLVDACVRLVRPALRARELTVDCELAVGELLVRGDRAQLMQVLVNLLLNAVEASPTGGRLVVTGQGEPGWVELRVRDEGRGIPPEDLLKVCDPFFTTKPEGEGTGLGLAVSLGIVRAHGGTLELESKVGRGTTVVVRLPRPEEEAAESVERQHA